MFFTDVDIFHASRQMVLQNDLELPFGFELLSQVLLVRLLVLVVMLLVLHVV